MIPDNQVTAMPAERLFNSFDYLFYFHDPRGRGGAIRAYGWAYLRKNDGSLETPESIELAIDGKSFAYPVDMPREFARPGEPLHAKNCGFDIILRTATGFDGIDFQVRFKKADGSAVAPSGCRLMSARSFVETQVSTSPLPELKRKKIENLFLSESERLNRTVELASKPVFMHIDPAFKCQLKCPHCHGRDARAAGYDMKNMSRETFGRILERYGDTLITAFLYNWGEPLLNKHFLEFVERLKDKQCVVRTSTNFSLPLSDGFIDRLVTSGLDEITFSIDGATQGTYETYRAGGDLQLLLGNLRRLATAKLRLGSRTPFLRWQYLRFPWNLHEIEQARALAGEIGVDAFSLHPGGVFNYDYSAEDFERSPGVIAERTPEIHARYAALFDARHARGAFFGCDHLYRGLTIFSDGSVKPCCKVFLQKDSSGFIASHETTGDFSNSPLHLSARESFRYPLNLPLSGYEPCINCTFMYAGHVHIGLDFHQFLILAEGGRRTLEGLRQDARGS